MPDPRPRLVVSAVLSLVLLGAIALPAAASSPAPPGVDHFLQALAHVESGGRYTARNAHTGAYGKYQVMPHMWRAWARVYLGSSRARPTPANQERLVRAVITSAYRRFGRWDVVAYWWLNGRAVRDPVRWDRWSRRYVGKVMIWFHRYGDIVVSGASPSGQSSPSGQPSPSPSAQPSPSPSAQPSPSGQPSPSPNT
ncbi:MAG TPA: transglycosylase family protein [Candidatus Dormibacteraeota bacterium]|nr:transglycosylase family protein [Candidatus Dormibacteraeota bacterium]